MRFLKGVGISVFLCLVLVGSAGAGELVVNGGFETGDFTGWTAVDNGSGAFYVYSGTDTPGGFFPGTILPPPQGSYAAVTDQGGPGNHIIYQDIAIPVGVKGAGFSATVYVENQADDYYIGADLSNTTVPNQQMRVDIMDPAAPVDDVGTGVLRNVFQTSPGDPLSIGYTTIFADLTPYAGQTVRIRIAEVDNLNFFYGAVDNVSVQTAFSVPTLSEWGMIIFSILLAASAIIALRRRQTNTF